MSVARHSACLLRGWRRRRPRSARSKAARSKAFRAQLDAPIGRSVRSTLKSGKGQKEEPRANFFLPFAFSLSIMSDVMKKKLTARRKSELCLMCGKCCMTTTFFGGEVDDEARDEIHWMELHGFKIDYVTEEGQLEYYFSIPQRCNALQEI